MTRPVKRALKIQKLRTQIQGCKRKHRLAAVKERELVCLMAQQLRFEMRQGK